MHKTLAVRMFILILAGLLPACVTINIYFPAAAAEKAADRIIDEVWQLQQSSSQALPEPGSSHPQNKVTP
ncbi:MAG: hypothetical protein WBH99_03930 [Azovibrio sp.]|uniref:hypothetical protein n=1 Tax=Azovibrio sp. TaxID=1872673 RepID=UPI003C727E38